MLSPPSIACQSHPTITSCGRVFLGCYRWRRRRWLFRRSRPCCLGRCCCTSCWGKEGREGGGKGRERWRYGILSLRLDSQPFCTPVAEAEFCRNSIWSPHCTVRQYEIFGLWMIIVMIWSVHNFCLLRLEHCFLCQEGVSYEAFSFTTLHNAVMFRVLQIVCVLFWKWCTECNSHIYLKNYPLHRETKVHSERHFSTHSGRFVKILCEC